MFSRPDFWKIEATFSRFDRVLRFLGELLLSFKVEVSLIPPCSWDYFIFFHRILFEGPRC